MAEVREVFTVDCIWVIFYICTPSKKILECDWIWSGKNTARIETCGDKEGGQSIK